MAIFRIMKQISVPEFEQDIVSWLKRVSVEKEIVITLEGQPVATIIPFASPEKLQPLPDREEKIVRRSPIAVDSSQYISDMRD